MSTTEPLTSSDTDSSLDLYSKTGGRHDAPVDRHERRQRRVPGQLRPRPPVGHACVLPDRREAGRRRHRLLPRRLHARRWEPPRSSRPGPAPARTAPTTPSSRPPPRMAPASSSTRAGRWSAATPTTRSTCTSGSSRQHDARIDRLRRAATARSEPSWGASATMAPRRSSRRASRWWRRDTDTAQDVYQRAGGATTLLSVGPERRQRART